MMFKQRCLCAILIGSLACAALAWAQDYDDENYGNQGNNQGDSDGYGNNYNNDDGYNSNSPNYQQNVDQDSSNNNPNSYSPQSGNDADGDYEGDDGSAAAAAAASDPIASIARVKRSTGLGETASEPKVRVKRHGKYYIGPVYTYVKTDKHANFKWGVKHKVGKKHHG